MARGFGTRGDGFPVPSSRVEGSSAEMRRAVSGFVAATASRARASGNLASVGHWTVRRSSTAFVGAPTEAQQAALFEHYAIGLRYILAQTEDLSNPAVVNSLRALRDTAPVALERPFWGAQFLAMAFGHELGFAAANPPALRAIFDLGVSAAEHGLVPFHSMRAAHGQLRRLGVLSCAVVDPPSREERSMDVAAEPAAQSASPPTAWSLFASERVRQRVASDVRRGLREDGVAVVDDLLGSSLAGAVAGALREHVRLEKNAGALAPGVSDNAGRSNRGVRGDLVTWLAGDEGLGPSSTRGYRNETVGSETVGSTDAGAFPKGTSRDARRTLTAGAVAQWMRSCLSSHLLESLPEGSLLPSDAYVANAMLSVYAPGAPGFVPHRDCSSDADRRRITAVYYPNLGWDERDGGELVLRPSDDARRVAVTPRGDRLVAFWSDEVEHEVVGVRARAGGERLAISFWFLKP